MHPSEESYRVTLYVLGAGERSQRAVARLLELTELARRAGVHVQSGAVDVPLHPALAEQAGVAVTPTLEREQPAPRRRLVGDLPHSGGPALVPPMRGAGQGPDGGQSD